MNRQRMLVVGASGFLGVYAVQAAISTDAFEVIRGDCSSTGQEGTEEMDISDASIVDAVFRKTRPDLVLLLAAMSDIDRCEMSPEKAFSINARGAENVANACARANARMLFTSSAAVFDGTKHGYSEEDVATPLSVYGKTKLWAENAVKELMPSAVILRMALVLGFARKSGTNAMLDRVLDKWKAGEPLFFSTREERNPIDAASLSKIMIDMLAERELSGIYHLGALDCISRYELGLRLAARAGISAELVRPQDDLVPGRALRGEHHFLLTDKIRRDCGLELGSSDQVIERCFS